MEISKPLRIAIFGSGMGTNAKKIIEYFNNSHETRSGKITLIVCNKEKAGIVEIAKNNNIPSLIINKEDFYAGKFNQQIKNSVDFIVLAGFLLKMPASLIKLFINRIINIHPALLPLYGGKGMYGDKVHEAVLKSGDSQSGISIHYVDENYDTGKIIFQANCDVNKNDSISSLAKKIHLLEHQNFSKVIEKEVQKLNGLLNS